MPETPNRVKQERLRDRTRLTSVNAGAAQAQSVYVPNAPDVRPARALNLSSLSPTLAQIVEDLNAAENITAEAEAREKVSKLLNSTKFADLVDQGVPYSANPIAREVIQDAFARRGAREYQTNVEARIRERVAQIENGEAVIGDIASEIQSIQIAERAKFQEQFGALVGSSTFQRGRFEELLAGNENSAGVNETLLRRAQVEFSRAQDSAGEAAVRAAYFEDALQGFSAGFADGNAKPDVLSLANNVGPEMQARAEAVAQSFGYKAGPRVVAGALNDLAVHLASRQGADGEPLYPEDLVEAYIGELADTIRLPIPLSDAGRGGSRKKVALIDHPVAGPILSTTIARLGDSASREGSRKAATQRRKVGDFMAVTEAARRDLVSKHIKNPATFDLEMELESLLSPLTEDANLLAAAVAEGRDIHGRRIERDAGINRVAAQRAQRDGVRSIKNAASPEEAAQLRDALLEVNGVDVEALDAAVGQRVAVLQGAGHMLQTQELEKLIDEAVELIPSYTNEAKFATATMKQEVRARVQDAVAEMVGQGLDENRLRIAIGAFGKSEEFKALLEPLRAEGERRTAVRRELLDRARNQARAGIEDVASIRTLLDQGLVAESEADSIVKRAREYGDPNYIRSPQLLSLKGRFFRSLEGLLKTDDGRATVSGLLARGMDQDTLEARQPDEGNAEMFLLEADVLFERWVTEAHAATLNPELPENRKVSSAYELTLGSVKGFLGELAGEEFDSISTASEAEVQSAIERARQAARQFSIPDEDTPQSSERPEAEQRLRDAGVPEEQIVEQRAAPEESARLSEARDGFELIRRTFETEDRSGLQAEDLPLGPQEILAWSQNYMDQSIKTAPNIGLLNRLIGGESRTVYQTDSRGLWLYAGGAVQPERWLRDAMNPEAFPAQRVRARQNFSILLREMVAGRGPGPLTPGRTRMIARAVGVPLQTWLDGEKFTPLGLDGEPKPLPAEESERLTVQDRSTIQRLAERTGHLRDRERDLWYLPEKELRRRTDVVAIPGTPLRQSDTVSKLTRAGAKAHQRRQFALEEFGVPTESVDPFTTGMFADEEQFLTARADSRVSGKIAVKLGVPVDGPLLRQFWYNQELLLKLRKD